MAVGLHAVAKSGIVPGEGAIVHGYTADEFAATLAHLAEGRIDGAPLITGRVGLDGVAQAFLDLGNLERHAKILVTR